MACILTELQAKDKDLSYYQIWTNNNIE